SVAGAPFDRRSRLRSATSTRRWRAETTAWIIRRRHIVGCPRNPPRARSMSRSPAPLLLLAALACGDASGPRPTDDVAAVTVRRADAAPTIWAGDTTRLVAVARTTGGATL